MIATAKDGQMTDARNATGGGSPEPETEDVLRERRLQRNLKFLVGGLGLLILLGLGAVVFKMASLATGGGDQRVSVTAPAAPQSPLGIELPKGAKVASVSLSGNRLAIHHESPAGTGITVIDVESGRRIIDLTPQEAVPRD